MFTPITLLAPNRLPVIGALTESGAVCKLLEVNRDGPAYDYQYELPESPMVSPTVLVDSEGNHWTYEQVEGWA